MSESESIPFELAFALRVLLDESIEDRVYHVREQELLGWEGPRVQRYSDACQVVHKYAAEKDATKRPRTLLEHEVREATETRDRAQRLLQDTERRLDELRNRG